MKNLLYRLIKEYFAEYQQKNNEEVKTTIKLIQKKCINEYLEKGRKKKHKKI